MAKTALLFGSTGLVGGKLLEALLQSEDYEKIVSFVRKPTGISHSKLEEASVDFSRLSEIGARLRGDDLFYALGTTIRKAGSQDAFRKVDFTYGSEIAKLAAQNGVKKFLLVSSIGADPRSNNFYLRTKGELEQAVAHAGFLEAHLFRPSILVGNRAESRPLERVGIEAARLAAPFLLGPLRKYRATHAEAVAQAMVQAARENAALKVTVHEALV